MFCFNCKPVIRLSEDARKLSKSLENLSYVYLALSVLKLLLGDFNNFLNDILTIVMIIITYVQANYFMASFLIFILLFQSFYLVVVILLFLQNYIFGFLILNTFLQYFYLSIILSSLVLNIYLIHYAFLAYREYKALYREQLTQALIHNYERIPDQELDNRFNVNNTGAYVPFQGRGASWGAN